MSFDAAEASDEALLGRFNDGDASAFEVLLERYRRPIYNFLLRSTRDPHTAQDLLQDVFLRVVQSAGDFKREAKFSTWLYTIARNLSVDTSRKQALRRHPSLDGPAGREGSLTLGERAPSPSPIPDRRLVSKDLGERITAAVESLPAEQREVFLLRQLQNLPFRDIAEIVGVPENTVKSRMRYALERLQSALAEYEDYVRELS